MKERVRARLPAPALTLIRRGSRLRFAAKIRNVRTYHDSFRRRPWPALKYVLLDPQVGDFSYELRNEAAFGRDLAAALGVPESRILERFAEMRASPALNRDLRRRTRWHFELKRPVAFGPRMAWYALVRELRPRVVVETGVHHGFGSLVLLEALRRNAEEGDEGRLISADLDDWTGWVVPDALAVRWRKLLGKADEVVAGALDGEPIDLLIHDTPPRPEIERSEYELALAHRRGRVTLVSGSNGDQTGVLPQLAARHNARFHFVREVPDHPIYRGQGVCLVTVGDAESAAG